MNKITIEGKDYFYCMRMGVLRRYKQITGESVEKIGNDESKAITLAYCALLNGCKLAGVEVSLSEDDFADYLTPDQFAEMSTNLAGGQTAQGDVSSDSKKK